MATMTKFQILEKIGEGGMGAVYKGRLYNDSGFEKIVAAKKIFRDSSKPLSREIFKEAEVLSKLNHQNICGVIDIREEEDSAYILMELIDGPTLSEVLQLGIQKGYCFTEEFLRSIAKQILKGLQHAHSLNNGNTSVLHRDLSPHNVMINSQGVVKILDFGLAKIENRELSQTAQSIYGKIRYCAPEIFLGNAHSIRSDLYALGLILYELSICAKVFDGVSEAQIMFQIQNSNLNFESLNQRGYSDDLNKFIELLAAKEANGRPLDATEALAFMQGRLSTSGAVSEDVLIQEIEKLKMISIEKTKTLFSQVKIKPKQSIRPWSVNVLISAIVLVIIFVIGTNYSKFKKAEQIVIKVISEGREIELSSPVESEGLHTVGADTGYSMDMSSCLFSTSKLLSFPSLLFDGDVESKLKSFNMNHTPNFFLSAVNQNFKNTDNFFEILKKNCNHNETFKLASTMYEDFRNKTQLATKESFADFKSLREYLEPKVLFTEKKWENVFKASSEYLSANEKIRLEQQLESLKVFDIKILTGFNVINIDEQIFPENVAECRLLLDTYWVKSVFADIQSVDNTQNFSVILVPFPVGAEMSKYGKNFIEFKDNYKLENSQFKKKGVCVYERKKGEVMESSLRRF